MTELRRFFCSCCIGVLLYGCALSVGDANLRLERISVLSEFDKGLLRQYLQDSQEIYPISANAQPLTREWVRIDISTTDDWVSLGPMSGNVVEPVAYICSGPNKGEYLIPRGIVDSSGVDLNLIEAATRDLADGKGNARQYYAIFLAVNGYYSPIEGASRRYFSGGNVNADVCIRMKFSRMLGSALSRELLITRDEFLNLNFTTSSKSREIVTKSGSSKSGSSKSGSGL